MNLYCSVPFLQSCQCQLCWSGTCHNRWSTWKMKIILFKPVSCTSRNKSKYKSYIVGNIRGDWCTDTFINKTYKYTTIGECQSLSNPLFIWIHRDTDEWKANQIQKGANIYVTKFGPVFCRDIKHSLSQHATFSPRVCVPIEGSSPWPVMFVITTARIDHKLAHKTKYFDNKTKYKQV